MATSGDDIINGGVNDDNLNGLGGNDILRGFDGNDVLIGGGGVDSMYGGNGDDTYFIAEVGDRAIEYGPNTHTPGGRDTVKSTVSFTLGLFIEDLFLLGDAAINAVGNNLANNLTGNRAANILNGGYGADVMTGKGGDDIYIVDNVGDRAVENDPNRVSGGIDLVKSSVSFTLGLGVEKLTLVGTKNISGAGNALANVLIGNDGANILAGGNGADIISGGRGGDRINGGAGADRLVYASAADSTSVNFDTVVAFNFEEDKIDVTGTPPTYQGDIVQGGRLARATFDADLAAAVNGVLGDNEAVVFIASSGDFAGQTFLVVDANDQLGYQAGGDYVVRVQDSPIPTSTDFFI